MSAIATEAKKMGWIHPVVIMMHPPKIKAPAIHFS
jgi:hypothetical protein